MTDSALGVNDDAVDIVREALHKAWQLGQTYWQQADSEYISQNKKTEATREKFQQLVGGTLAAMQIVTVKTARELELEDLLTSARCIAQRKGADTAWDRFDARLRAAGIGSVTAKVFKILPSDADDSLE
jgi:hypothetical protein